MNAIDIFMIATIVILILLLISLFYRWIKNSAKLKKEKDCIRIKKSLFINWFMLAAACLSIVFLGCEIHDSSVRIRQINDGYYDDIMEQDEEQITANRDILLKNESRKKMASGLLIGIWSIDFIIYLLDLIIWRYGYVSANGVYYSGTFLPAEKTSYLIGGNKLRFYRKRSIASPEYTVIENHKQLESMLSEHYQPKN